MESPENDKVIFTGDIPLCPYCKKPTVRKYQGGTKTDMYYPPTYNKEGKNINPDRNIRTLDWHCSECKNTYITKGNIFDGYSYVKIEPDGKNKVL